jgi:hypothetical protein
LSFKDFTGKPAVFTAVCLVANPDFKAIKDSGFQEYYYELIPVTLNRVPGCEGSFELWKQGISKGIFIPQFHGREHLNISVWMHALKRGHQETREVFDEGMWGYVNSFFDGRIVNYQEAYNIHDPDELPLLEEILKDGLNQFERLFGYRAKLFVAPNGEFSNKLEKCLALNGIKYISQAKIQREPLGHGKTRKVFHYLGMRNKWDQIYFTRNCFFEPGSLLKTDWVDSCLNEIESAFRWNKPAIISTHRVNYIGSLNRVNRENSLKQLEKLLSGIKNRWPNVEFLSSDQLGALISES